jgi:primosomal protein N' (replication factor Y) (superfamily II helicase)
VPRVARVWVEVEPLHLDRPFDYLLPDPAGDDALEHEVVVGSRVEVVFSGRRRRGLVVELTDTTDVPEGRLRPVRRVLGPHAWATPDEIAVLRWAADRWGAPAADVVRHALPSRTVDVERRAEAAGWFPPGRARRPSSDPAPDPERVAAAWAAYGDSGTDLLAACAGGPDAPPAGTDGWFWRPSPDEDVAARLAELAQATLAGGRDVLLVVPDPASPVADAVVTSAADLAVDARGGPSPRRAYGMWLQARCGQARVVVGERGVAFWPLERLGLAVVLDEANPALKERRSPRHHVREVVLERARRAGAVGLLVGTVPSAPAWRLLTARRLAPVVPIRDAERDAAPLVHLDTGEGGPRTRIGSPALKAMRRALADGAYAVVLAARRGEGRALVCRGCTRMLRCPTCASSLAPAAATRGRGAGSVLCEGCGWRSPGQPTCARCGDMRFVPLAAGAERLATELQRSLPDATVAVLEGYAAAPPPAPAVLVATRGAVLDAPPGRVGAVVVPDVDGMLRRPALDASEDTLRLLTHLARWTVASGGAPGRGAEETHPSVVVQTREPTHPALAALVAWDSGGFWRAETATRAALRFPPAAHALRLDAPATAAGAVTDGLAAALDGTGDEVLGPVPLGDDGARIGWLVKADDRVATVAALREVRETWAREGLDVRLDVDPVDAL